MNKKLIYIGPFPRPVNGQNLVTEVLANQLINSGLDLKIINTSSGAGLFSILKKVLLHIYAALSIIFQSGNIYISLNSNKGMWLSLLLIIIGKLKGKVIGVHHHAFNHIRHKNLAMTLITKCLGKKGFHIVLGSAMEKGLRNKYPAAADVVILNNSNIISTELSQLNHTNNSNIKIGHLSNLTVEKGCAWAIEAVLKAKAKGFNVELHLAGPVSDSRLEVPISEASKTLSDCFKMWGPVYGEEKISFFDTIDILLFPSQYKNEAEPLVVLESMASGIPVLAFDVGCISDDIGQTGGKIISSDYDGYEDFLNYLNYYSNIRKECSDDARKRFYEILKMNNDQYDLLLNKLAN